MPVVHQLKIIDAEIPRWRNVTRLPISVTPADMINAELWSTHDHNSAFMALIHRDGTAESVHTSVATAIYVIRY